MHLSSKCVWSFYSIMPKVTKVMNTRGTVSQMGLKDDIMRKIHHSSQIYNFQVTFDINYGVENSHTPRWKLYLSCLNILQCYMWCDLGKSVGSYTCDIFRFLIDWSAHLERYILQKTPIASIQWFRGYEILKDSQNNRKQ